VGALNEVPQNAWTPLLKSRRATPSLGTISDYLSTVGTDATLVAYLTGTESISAEGALESELVTIAGEVLSVTGVPAADRARLVASLQITDPLPVAGIVVDAPALPGELLKREVIADDLTSFEWARSAGVGSLKSFLTESAVFEDLLPSIVLTSAEMDQFFDPKFAFPEPARMLVHDNISQFESALTKSGWQHYAHWMVGLGIYVESDRLLAHYRAGIWLDDAIDLVLIGHEARTDSEVERLVAALGPKYRNAVTVGRGSESLEGSNRHIALAELIDARRLIASWRLTVTRKVQIYRRQK
jgi:hypothetical protein